MFTSWLAAPTRSTPPPHCASVRKWMTRRPQRIAKMMSETTAMIGTNSMSSDWKFWSVERALESPCAAAFTAEHANATVNRNRLNAALESSSLRRENHTSVRLPGTSSGPGPSALASRASARRSQS